MNISQIDVLKFPEAKRDCSPVLALNSGFCTFLNRASFTRCYFSLKLYIRVDFSINLLTIAFF